MSESQGHNGNGAGPARPWGYFFYGGLVLCTLAVAAGILLVQFIEHRPVDLRRHSRHLAGILEETLIDLYVPAQNIGRSEPKPRHDARGQWLTTEFRVAVPAQLNSEELARMLENEMLRHYVQIHDVAPEQGARRLSAQVGGFEIARLRLSRAAPQETPRTDLRAACVRIAGDLVAVMAGAGIASDAITLGAQREQSDEETRWTTQAMEVILPAGMSPGELRGRIEERMAARDVRVATEPLRDDGTIQMRVKYGGKPCAELTCRVSGAMPAPREPAPAPDAEQTVAEGEEETAVPELHELPLDSESREGAEAPLPPPAETERPPPGPRSDAAPARLAVILDDGGYGGETTDQALKLDKGVTLAILPHTPFAEQTARAAVEKGFEVMVHMPMETYSKEVRAFPKQLTVDMGAEEIARLTTEALKRVPGAKGVNNHTGSRFTAEPDKLRPFFQVIKPANLYFVDSRTSASTRAYAVARHMNVPAAERDVFLDNSSAPDAIRQRLAELVARAKKNGQAIGIGHFRPSTVAVLSEELPKLATQDVRLVHVSELIQTPRQLAMETQ